MGFGKPLTDKELEILKNEYPIIKSSLIAEKLDRPVRQIYYHAFIHGIKKNNVFNNSQNSGRFKRGNSTQFKKGHVPFNKIETRMDNEQKKLITDHLFNCMNKENLNNNQTAEALKISPDYMSRLFNSESWNSVSELTWDILLDWYNSKEKIIGYGSWNSKPQNIMIEKVNKIPEKINSIPKRKYNKPEKLQRNSQGVSLNLIKELQIRQKQLLDEIIEIRKLLEQYEQG